MTRKGLGFVIGAVMVVGFGVAFAQQPATITQTYQQPARFQPVTPVEEVGDNKFLVLRDTKADSGNTCFLLIQSKGLSGLATVVLPATACQ
jgi:hypothetical protein